MRRIIIKRWSTFAVVKCLFIVSAGAEIAHMSGKRSRYRTVSPSAIPHDCITMSAPRPG